MLLPLNNSNSELNHVFFLKLRGDYWVHILLFFPWMIMNLKKNLVSSNLNWMVFGIVFAFTAEGVQFVIPYRTFNINDALSNISGVILGACIFMLLVNKTKR